MSKKEYIIPIFIPFLGCPHDCVFCNQVKITNYKDKMDKEKLIDEIEKNLLYFPKNDNDKEIAFFGGSFTGLSEDIMIDYLTIARDYKEKGIIDRIRISTRPDYINNSILDILKEYKVNIIELGIQSLDQEVLDHNERGHSILQSKRASDLIKEYDFTLGHQVMPGLYKDSYDKSIKTAIESTKMKPDIVRIYPTLVIKDTKLYSLYKLGLYEPLDLEDAVKLSAEIYMIYRYKDIKVIRIGLQPTENINVDADVISGPFHPAFRQLVESYIYRNYLEELVNQYKIKEEITIYTNDRNISILAGNNKTNKEYFYNKYNINIKFKTSKEEYLLYKDKKIQINIDKYIDNHIRLNYGGDLL